MKRVILAAILLVLSSLYLTGCFEVTQDMTIQENGSGKFMMDMGVSEGLMSMAQQSGGSTENLSSTADTIKSNQYIKNVKVDETSKDGYRHYTVSGDIPDYPAFLKSLSDSGSGGTSNITMSMEKLPNGNWEFRETIDMASQMASSSSSSDQDYSALGQGLMAQAMADRYWNVKLHLPNMVNTNGNWDSKTQTVEWNIPMASVITQKQELKAEFRPTPWYVKLLLPVGLALVALVLLAGAEVFFLRRRQAPAVTPITQPPAEPPSDEIRGQ